MSRWLFAGALMALACGGEAGSISDEQPAAGAGGELAGSGGDAPTVGGGGQSSAGTAGGGSGGEVTATGGGGSASGGSPAGGASGAPQGGLTSGGAGGQFVAGGGQSGAATAGAGGKASGGGGSGGQRESACSTDSWLDCNGVLDDGTGHIPNDDCETPRLSHDDCGECGHQCGLSQVCKLVGSPGAWTYFCGSP
jgi:hypothetical protein